MCFFISTTAEQLGVILSIPGRRVSTSDPPSTSKAPRRGTQCAADGRCGVRTRADGKGRNVRPLALSLARSLVSSGAGHRESGDWRGASCGASEGAALALSATILDLHTHIRGANDWLAGWLTGWLRAFPPRSRFPRHERGREGEREGEREEREREGE